MNDMSPVDWALRPLKRYAQFNGRAPRAEYWWFWVAYTGFGILLQIFVRITPIFGLLGLLYLGLIIPMIAVTVRRLHDIDRPGWWLLAPIVSYLIAIAVAFSSRGGTRGLFSSAPTLILMLVAAVSAVVLFVFSVLPGTKGPNRYGPDPYDEENLEEVFA